MVVMEYLSNTDRDHAVHKLHWKEICVTTVMLQTASITWLQFLLYALYDVKTINI